MSEIGYIMPNELTRKQLNLIEAALAIRDKSALEADALGFSTRVLVQASLPHRDPGNDLPFWERTNGNIHLTIQPRWYMKNGKPYTPGYPYASRPRLIMLFLCTEALRTGERDISLGRSMSSFMRSLGLGTSGGKEGPVRYFKDQLRRLVTAHIHLTIDEEVVEAGQNAGITERYVFWWDEHRPDQQSLFDSYVRLNEGLFNEIIKHAVPLDMRTIAEFQNNSMALDYYTWLTHKVAIIKKSSRVPWVLLEKQIGSNYKKENRNKFRKESKDVIRRIMLLWPGLRIEECVGGIIVYPGEPHVARKLVNIPLALPDPR